MKRIMMFAATIAFAYNAMAQQPTLESGVKMYYYKNYVSAQRILTPLSVKEPMANYYLGLSYLDAGNIAKANYQFAKYPEDFANIAGTARVAFAQKDANKGNAILKDLVAKAKKKEFRPFLYAALALTYSEGTDHQQAIQWYKEVLTRDANNLEAKLGLGDTYRKTTGGGGEAMNNYESIIEKEPNNSLVLSRIGNLWYDAKNYQSALDFYQKATNADTANPLPNKYMAEARQRTGRYELALEEIRKYLRHSDNTLADQINYVEILYLAKSNCEAARLAKELLEQELPADKRVNLTGLLGYAQSDCGDSIEALKNVRQYFAIQDAKKLRPGDYLEYGKLWLKLGNVDSASYFYNKGLEGDTSRNKSDIYRQIAEALRQKKDFCNAASWYDKLVKSNPNTQAFDYFYRGFTYYFCRNYDAAATAFAEYENKYPEQVNATYWRARSTAAIDSEATTGAAAPFFSKWIEKIGADVDKKEKKADVTKAYQYLVLYYYNAKDKENGKLYMDKLRAFDPNDGLLKQIDEMEKSGTPAKKAPAKKPAGK